MIDDKVNILVVDDLPDKRLAFQVVLEELGQNLVKTARELEASLEALGGQAKVLEREVQVFR